MDEMGPMCETYARAVDIIGRRWTGTILRVMLSGKRRFRDIARDVEGISDRLLSVRLKELEAEVIVERTVTPSVPVCITYTLTKKGEALTPVLTSLETWATEWVGR